MSADMKTIKMDKFTVNALMTWLNCTQDKTHIVRREKDLHSLSGKVSLLLKHVREHGKMDAIGKELAHRSIRLKEQATLRIKRRQMETHDSTLDLIHHMRDVACVLSLYQGETAQFVEKELWPEENFQSQDNDDISCNVGANLSHSWKHDTCSQPRVGSLSISVNRAMKILLDTCPVVRDILYQTQNICWTLCCQKMFVERTKVMPFFNTKEHDIRHPSSDTLTSIVPIVFKWFANAPPLVDACPVSTSLYMIENYNTHGNRFSCVEYFALHLIPMLDNFGFVNSLNCDYTSLWRCFNCLQLLSLQTTIANSPSHSWQKPLSMIYGMCDTQKENHAIPGSTYLYFWTDVERSGQTTHSTRYRNQSSFGLSHDVRKRFCVNVRENWKKEYENSVTYTKYTSLSMYILFLYIVGMEVDKSIFSSYALPSHALHTSVVAQIYPKFNMSVMDCLHLFGWTNMWRKSYLWHHASVHLLSLIDCLVVGGNGILVCHEEEGGHKRSPYVEFCIDLNNFCSTVKCPSPESSGGDVCESYSEVLDNLLSLVFMDIKSDAKKKDKRNEWISKCYVPICARDISCMSSIVSQGKEVHSLDTKTYLLLGRLCEERLKRSTFNVSVFTAEDMYEFYNEMVLPLFIDRTETYRGGRRIQVADIKSLLVSFVAGQCNMSVNHSLLLETRRRQKSESALYTIYSAAQSATDDRRDTQDVESDVVFAFVSTFLYPIMCLIVVHEMPRPHRALKLSTTRDFNLDVNGFLNSMFRYSEGVGSVHTVSNKIVFDEMTVDCTVNTVSAVYLSWSYYASIGMHSAFWSALRSVVALNCTGTDIRAINFDGRVNEKSREIGLSLTRGLECPLYNRSKTQHSLLWNSVNLGKDPLSFCTRHASEESARKRRLHSRKITRFRGVSKSAVVKELKTIGHVLQCKIDWLTYGDPQDENNTHRKEGNKLDCVAKYRSLLHLVNNYHLVNYSDKRVCMAQNLLCIGDMCYLSRVEEGRPERRDLVKCGF